MRWERGGEWGKNSISVNSGSGAGSLRSIPAGTMRSTGSVGTSIAVSVAVRRPGAPFSKMSFSTLTINLLQHVYQVINVLLCARLGHAEKHVGPRFIAGLHAGIVLAKWVATDDASLFEVLLQGLY